MLPLVVTRMGSTGDESNHASCVDSWRARAGADLAPDALLVAFEHAFSAVWQRARVTLGDVTLVAIGDRIIHEAMERHPVLRDIHLELTGISCDDLQRRADELDRDALEHAVRSVLIDLLAVLDRLTAGVLTSPLHAALSDDRDEDSASS